MTRKQAEKRVYYVRSVHKQAKVEFEQCVWATSAHEAREMVSRTDITPSSAKETDQWIVLGESADRILVPAIAIVAAILLVAGLTMLSIANGEDPIPIMDSNPAGEISPTPESYTAFATYGLPAIAYVICLSNIVIAIVEESIELQRRHWSPIHLALTPVHLVYDVLTFPKHILPAVARFAAWGGVAGARPGQRFGILVFFAFVANILALSYSIPSAWNSITGANDRWFTQVMVLALVLWGGKELLAGGLNELFYGRRFDSSYQKPVATLYYKELVILVVISVPLALAGIVRLFFE